MATHNHEGGEEEGPKRALLVMEDRPLQEEGVEEVEVSLSGGGRPPEGGRDMGPGHPLEEELLPGAQEGKGVFVADQKII